MTWSARERAWRDDLVNAALPPSTDGRFPGCQSVDLERAFGEMLAVSPPLVRFGLRVSVWMLTALALVMTGRRFASLDVERRDDFLRRLHGSRVYLARQLVESIKVMACLAAFSDENVRASLEPGERRGS